jgi:hypothetical protein
MLHLLSWTDGALGARESFYAYHPPLGFLFGKLLLLVGLSDVWSATVVSSLASLGATLALRAALQHAGLLHRPIAIAFLYLSASLPVQVFLASSVNLDVLQLLWASVTILLSMQLWWNGRPAVSQRWRLSAWLTLTLAAALLTKTSGTLLLIIPVTVALLAPAQRFAWRPALAGLSVAVVSCLLVSPYYLQRYYAPEGRIFVSNTDFIIGDTMEEARNNLRTRGTLAFIGDLLGPSPAHATSGWVERDRTNLRLSDTWRDVWLQEGILGPLPPLALWLGQTYLVGGWWLLVVGGALLLRQLNPQDPWHRFGGVLCVIGAVQMAGFVTYLYDQPFAEWGPTKAIYIAPALLTLTYLLSGLWLTTGARHRLGIAWQAALAFVVPVFLSVNHLLPLY